MNSKEPTETTDSKPFLPDREKLNAHPETLSLLEAIEDPLRRFRRASEIATSCYRKNAEMKLIRARRRWAVVALFRYHGVNKAEITRLINARDRRVVDSAFGKVDLRQIPTEWVESREIALEAARNLHADYVERELKGTTAREVRRELVYRLTRGHFGPMYHLKGSELAEIAKNSSALMSQQITGSSNRAKLDRARKRKLEEGGPEATVAA